MLYNELQNATALISSATFKEQRVVQSQGVLPIVSVKTWLEVVDCYYKMFCGYLVSVLVDASVEAADGLTMRCPQWQAGAKEDAFDESKLADLVKTLPLAKIKTSIVLAFGALSIARITSTTLRFKHGLASKDLAGLAPTVDRTMNAIAVGKEAVALRSTGVVMASLADEAPARAKALLDSLKDVRLPASVRSRVELAAKA